MKDTTIISDYKENNLLAVNLKMIEKIKEKLLFPQRKRSKNKQQIYTSIITTVGFFNVQKGVG